MEFRIPQNMIEVIMQCVSSPSLQIFWNGEPTEKWKPTRKEILFLRIYM